LGYLSSAIRHISPGLPNYRVLLYVSIIFNSIELSREKREKRPIEMILQGVDLVHAAKRYGRNGQNSTLEF
jgi:hypothetical protein